MLRRCCFVVHGVAALACDVPFFGEKPAPRARTPFERAVRGPREESIPCETDADCPTSACGPCRPAQVFTRGDFRTDCKTNPCAEPRSVCGPEQVCVVGPTTGPRPPRKAD